MVSCPTDRSQLVLDRALLWHWMGVGGGLSAQLCIHYTPQKEPVKKGRVCIIQCSGWIIGYS